MLQIAPLLVIVAGLRLLETRVHRRTRGGAASAPAAR
jgi:hypothetical protein